VSETVPPVSRLLDLTGRVALVTAGGFRWGRFRDRPAIRRGRGRAEAVDAELGDRSSVTRLVAAAADHFGGLDIVVDNAGALSRYARRAG